MGLAAVWGGGVGGCPPHKRLVEVAAAIAARPAQSLPRRMGGVNELTGAYRLFSKGSFEPDAVLRPHALATLESLADEPLVLVVQDTTVLDYTTHPGKRGLGRIGDGNGRGLLQHGALAVTPRGLAVAGEEWIESRGRVRGVLDLKVHPRVEPPQGETRKGRQSRWSEPDVWGDAATAVAGLVESLEPGSRPGKLVHVGDRHADVWRFLDKAVGLGHGFVVRAMHLGRYADEGRERGLLETLEAQEEGGVARVEVRPQHKKRKKRGKRVAVREGREAKLELRWARVTLPPPVNDRRSRGREAVEAWAVLAQEKDPPPGEEAIRWVLLSSERVEDADAARRVLGLYRCRWCIEEWHRCLKEGCGIEKARLRDAQGIARLAAVLGPVAARLLALREAARDVWERRSDPGVDGGDAGEPPGPRGWREAAGPHVLRVVAKLAKRDPATLGADEFWLTIAQRGGYLARKNDPPPGWGAIWHGWREITLLAQGLALAEGGAEDV